MKPVCLFLFLAVLAGCVGKSKEVATGEGSVPVYKVDLERLDSVSVFDLFSKIEVIPLETSLKSELASAEFGVHGNRFVILDRRQGLCFGFALDGKFKYVTENKAKVSKDILPDGSMPVYVSNPLSYYRNFQWHYYLTYRNRVYTMDKDGNETTCFRWDFGKHNGEKSPMPDFFHMSRKRDVVLAQKDWMQDHVSFALSEMKENDTYIYVLVDRVFSRPDVFDKSQLTHLFWNKPAGKYVFFSRFTEGVELSPVTRMNDTCMMALVWYKERDRYVTPGLLDAANLERFRQVKPDDNPMILRYHFKR